MRSLLVILFAIKLLARKDIFQFSNNRVYNKKKNHKNLHTCTSIKLEIRSLRITYRS